MDFGDSNQNVSFCCNNIRCAEWNCDDQQDLEIVHVGDILNKLSILERGVEALRTGIAAIASDSFCLDSDYGTESKLSILSEILSADLLGRTDEIRGMLAEVREEYNTKTIDCGDRLAYERIEREINRIYPDLERTVHLVRVSEHNRIAQASRRQSKQDQVTEANIRTQVNDGMTPPKVISLKIAKTANETTNETETDNFYRHVFNTTEKSIVTEENAVKTVAALLEEDLAKGESRAICTRKRVTRTQECKGQLPVKEILMNVRVTQKTNELTGEIEETCSDLETESEFDQCFVMYHTGKTPETFYNSDSTKRFPSGYNSVSQTSLDESASDRNVFSRQVDQPGKPDCQSDEQNKPVQLEKKIAPYFEVLLGATESELQESEKRCFQNLRKNIQQRANDTDQTKEPIIFDSVDKDHLAGKDTEMKSGSKELLDALEVESNNTDNSMQLVEKAISHTIIDENQGFDLNPPKEPYLSDTTKHSEGDGQLESQLDIKSFLKKELNIENSDNDQRISAGYGQREYGPETTSPQVFTALGKVTLPMLRSSAAKLKFPKKAQSKELYKERRYLNISVVEAPEELEVIVEEPFTIAEKLSKIEEECPLVWHYDNKTTMLDLTESDIGVLFSERARRQKIKNMK